MISASSWLREPMTSCCDSRCSTTTCNCRLEIVESSLRSAIVLARLPAAAVVVVDDEDDDDDDVVAAVAVAVAVAVTASAVVAVAPASLG